jgi:hypothetical protein
MAKCMVMKLKIKKLHWWTRSDFIYRIRLRAVVFYDGGFYNIDGFKGKNSKVSISGSEIVRIGVAETRQCRFDAILRRMSMCNHIDLKRLKYKFDIMTDNCQFCYLYTRCNLANYGRRDKKQLYFRDIALVSKFLDDNRKLS